MSIDPVQFGPTEPVERSLPAKTTAQGSPTLRSPSVGIGSKPETWITQSAPEPDFIPSEEVKLQRDLPTGEQVYQFIDRRSGVLILQIPSEQMLNFIHEVQQEWQQLTSKPVGAGSVGKER